MYLSIYNTAGASTQQTAQPTKPQDYKTKPSTLSVPNAQSVSKIYVRVPDMIGEAFLKAKNVIDIFNEGTVRVIFYDSSTQKYAEYSERLHYSEYVYKQLCEIVSKDNVVLK